MNHVTIKREHGKKLAVLRSISVTNQALLDYCRQHGPGVYIASWPVQQNAGKGKPRIKREVSKKVFVYEDDCQEIPIATDRPGERGGVTVVTPRQDIESLRAVMADTVTEIVKPLSGMLADMKTRLEALEDQEDEEEPEEPEEPDFMADIMQAMRKPEYAELTAALFMPTTDDVKFAQIDKALQNRPEIAHAAVMDVLQIVLKRFAA